VAAHRLGFTRVPAPYGDPAADDALATDVAAGREAPLNRMHDYLAARTSFFDRVVVAAIDRGVPLMEQSHTEIARCFAGLAQELTRNDVETKRATWSLFKTV